MRNKKVSATKQVRSSDELVGHLNRRIAELQAENTELKAMNKDIQAIYDELRKKTQGNLGVLVPQLQKERDTWMQVHEGHLKTIEQLRLSNKRLQDIVNLWVNGTLR